MYRSRAVVIALALSLLAVAGCRDDGPTTPAEFPSEGEVFLDGYADGVTFQAFSGSKLDAVQVDGSVAQSGNASLQVTVPAEGSGSGGYAGGAFTADPARDLTEYDALTLWARAETAADLDVIGFGNDNTETSLYGVERRGVPLTGSWQKIVVPIPDPSVLSSEDGLFFFAEGPEGGAANTIWFDEVQFETLGTIADPRPAMASATLTVEVGGTAVVTGLEATYAVEGSDVTVGVAPAYFTFASSDESVAVVAEDGTIAVVGEGTATITAALDGVVVEGEVVVQTAAPPSAPAPTPDEDPSDVVSLFSDVYTDVTVDTWSAEWDDADVEDVTIAGDAAKRYTNLVFAGIEAGSAPIDATSMTHFHMDVYTPDPTAAPAELLIKLVDYGADGAFGGGDDVEHEITIDEGYTPPLATDAWVSLDIPLSEFAGLTTRGHIAQLILSGDPSTLYVDNVYFYDAGTVEPTGPTAAAPAPTQDGADVVSLFSGAYTDVTVDTWSAGWDDANVADVDIEGDATKLYTNLVFAGIEAGSAPIDASGMTHFSMDIWTPDATDAAEFGIKLVDFGADGAYDGGDDVEHEIVLDASTTPALATGTWVPVDLPLSDFTGLTTRGHIAQIVLSGDPNTVYVDNVYFYDGDAAAPTEPTTAAPTPSYASGDVISLYSGPYTDVTVDTWSADWDDADVADVVVEGDATKLYTNLVFAGIEAGSAPIDASGMTHISMDIWTPDATDAAELKIKLVDFGADGAYDGGDDVEHELTLDASTTPGLATGSWVTLNLPLSDFTGLTTRGHIAQLIISGDPNTLYVDNVLFHD